VIAVGKIDGHRGSDRQRSPETIGPVWDSQAVDGDLLQVLRSRDVLLLEQLLKSLQSRDTASAQELIVLDPRAPLDIANHFLTDRYLSPSGVRLLHARGKDLFCWDGCCYSSLSGDDARAALYRFLEQARQSTKDGNQPFRPSRSVVNNIEDALRAAAHIPSCTAAPSWLDGRQNPPIHEIVVCENGILHLPTRALQPLDPALFATSALPFAYESDGPAPEEWLRFLNTVWRHDPQAIQTLQEVLGYLVSGQTRQQKIFLLVGPRRSGKGTIGRVTRALLGEPNTVGPTLSSLTGQFGLEPLENRSLAVISDARLSGRVDQAVITERLLAISGEDVLTVDRKHRTAWTGKLPTRLLILTNELPRLTDGSGALASRFLMLTMTRSFLGSEDLGLDSRLMKELPGIFRWALDGWDRLRERGYFIPPKSSEEAVRELEDLSSPVGAFLRECCVLEAGSETHTDALYHAWREWCSRQGHDRVSSAQVFGRDLRAAVPGLGTAQRGTGSDRSRVYVGVGLLRRRTR
jgi:putative DNA primase/helicase